MDTPANLRMLRAAAALALLVSVGLIVYGLVIDNWWVVGMFVVTAVTSFSLYPMLLRRPQRK
ncbi:hypothetical protein [uncultured Agrococcus sp.]|uniref:hypothetical protein n=1 Tax=uncultured Agrococcus sp. TaxID=382258 RepID=UPI0025E5577E|nr:hypothetical protein [uncultured Agrococcus sp.]